MNFNDVAIVSIKGGDYRIHFWYMRKYDAINIMKNSDLKKVGYYEVYYIYIYILYIYIIIYIYILYIYIYIYICVWLCL